MQFLTKRTMPALIILALSLTEPAFATVTIGSGSTFDFGSGTFDFGCDDLVVAGQASGTTETLRSITNLVISAGGTLAPGAGNVSLGGDYANAGTFVPGTSRLAIVDACGNGGASHVLGSTAFYDFVVSTVTGKILTLPSAATQSVAHALTFQGAAGNLLNIVSSTPGLKALLKASPSASQTIGYVNARDNDASGGATIAPGLPSQYNSIDSGGLINWFGASTGGGGGGASLVPAPLLGFTARLALLLSLLLIAGKAMRRTS